MGESTQIEWADATVNLAWGCTKVSEGCKNCYAERLSKARYINHSFQFHYLNFEANAEKIMNWQKPKRIFINSMSDTFHEKVTNDVLDMWFNLFKVVPRHTFIILTKRINRAFAYFKTRQVPSNVWLGTSVENSNYLHRIEKLKTINAKVRFVSFEPLIGSCRNVNLEGIQWAIVGGESDYKKPRLMDELWAMEILEQCRKYGTAFFFKQQGGSNKNIDGSWGTRLLNDKTYQEFPNMDRGLQTKLI